MPPDESVAPPVQPPKSWPHWSVYRGAQEAILSLPSFFKTETVISGIMATDLFTLAAALGATIEEQVVTSLNSMREVWDPQDKYQLYHFVRQSQTFPDVLLKHHSTGDIIMGVELKGWYLLAKEGEPSFRYQVTTSACAAQDLLVVVPWALSNVISGTPKVFTPFIVSAQQAALYRNRHWQDVRKSESDNAIRSPQDVGPYPAKSDAIADKPARDDGGNFGRLARTGIMDEYMKALNAQRLCGIDAGHWRAFFKLFQDRRSADEMRAEVDALVRRLSKTKRPRDPDATEHLTRVLGELVAMLSE